MASGILEFKLLQLEGKSPAYICYRPGEKSYIFFLPENEHKMENLPAKFFTVLNNIEIVKELERSIQVDFIVWTGFEREGNMVGICPAAKYDPKTKVVLTNSAPIIREYILSENEYFVKSQLGYIKHSILHTWKADVHIDELFDIKFISSCIEEVENIGNNVHATFKCTFQHGENIIEKKGVGKFTKEQYQRFVKSKMSQQGFMRSFFSKIPLLGAYM